MKKISAIIPVGVRQADVRQLYGEYRAALESLGIPFEFVFVLDGPFPLVARQLKTLAEATGDVTIIGMARSFGEATALMAGFARASGNIILTLPAYEQIESAEIRKLVSAVDTADMAVGRRWPRTGTWLERLRRSAFHKLLGAVTGARFQDLGCGARAMRRAVLEDVSLYGDQHRFLPVLAARQGFSVVEIDVRQSPRDAFKGFYRPKEYTRRLLDIFSIFFIVRFTKKPLRFFGMVGVTMFGIGFAMLAYLVIDRLVFRTSLADRPALLLSSLIVVLGMQLFALGLLGELIIFTHARGIKDYEVETIVEHQDDGGNKGAPTPLLRREAS